MTLSPNDFEYLCGLIRKESGISLSEEKMYLIESRLLPLARTHGLSDIAALTAALRTDRNSELHIQLIEAMTTNETSFYRDIKPFQLFEESVIPHIAAHNASKNMRIWCAACSTGQEPYSLALMLKDKAAKFDGLTAEIHATDIDKTILKKAEDGIYSQFEVQRGLPINLLMKYFEQQESYGNKWVLKPEIKQMIRFKYLNLLEGYESMGKFDAIFCRNVLIYFEQETKADILNRLADCLKPHGVLFLGSAEAVTNMTDKLGIFQDIRSIFALK